MTTAVSLCSFFAGIVHFLFAPIVSFGADTITVASFSTRHPPHRFDDIDLMCLYVDGMIRELALLTDVYGQ